MGNNVSAYVMRTMSRIYVAIFITLIALGTTINAVSATTMSIDMALADSQNIAGDGCQACPDGDKAAPLCDLVCTTAFVTLPVSYSFQTVATLGQFHGFSDHGPPGRFGSPDPAPPKFIIQI